MLLINMIDDAGVRQAGELGRTQENTNQFAPPRGLQTGILP
jgi:hypothetical protein